VDRKIAPFVLTVEQTLSRERLDPFRSDPNDSLSIISNYFWNIALCQSLYPCIGLVEVAMRNAIHTSLADYFGRTNWFDLPGLLQTNERLALNAAKVSLSRAGKIMTPGRIVAELSFGFWTALLSSLYGNSPKGPRLWASPNSILLARAFPYAPASVQGYRSRVHKRFDDLRLLRNRVSHHEPVWKGVLVPSRRAGIPPTRTSIEDLHFELIDAIGWINPTLQGTVKSLDTFQDTYHRGHAKIASQIQSYIETT
jgi:hypothetical protein